MGLAVSPLKLVTFELELPRGSEPGTPRHQPVSRVVDVQGVRSIPALSSILMATAADIPGCESAAGGGLEVFLVDARGRRTRLAGRSQLKQLKRAQELHVTLRAPAPPTESCTESRAPVRPSLSSSTCAPLLSGTDDLNDVERGSARRAQRARPASMIEIDAIHD